MAHVWTQQEIRATVRAYLKIMNREDAGKKINKEQVYRDLNDRFPNHSPGAYGLKMQNISAILKESGRPFIEGLKPMDHYQSSLRDTVLDEVDKGRM